MTQDKGVPASPSGHSDEPASGLAADAGSVPNADELDREAKSFLLYVECRCVDQGGLLDGRQMNAEDMGNGKRFVAAGLMQFGRIPSHLVTSTNARRLNATHYAELTDAGWAIAHELRRERATRRGPFAKTVFADELVVERTAQAIEARTAGAQS